MKVNPGTTQTGRAFHLGLVAMPWAMFNRPSIQLGALKAYLVTEDPGIRVTTLHPFLGLAAAIGPALYRAISLDIWLSEGLYAGILFPERRDTLRPFLARRLKGCGQSGDAALADLWQKLEAELERWLISQDWRGFDLVGFSVCFNQLCASLLASSRIKALQPELPIVFGGSSCAGEAGKSLVKNFPQIDFLIDGEGELPLLALCRKLADRPEAVGKSALPPDGQPRELTRLDLLPTPDYDDYFKELRREFAGEPFVPELPVEFSRGCWWRKCVFCNLNLQWRGYRHKSAGRMREEIACLTERHACLDFFFTDNVLPQFDALRFFEKMAEDKRDLRFFAEIRVDQGGKTLETFRRGGLVLAQAGIEALSQSLLDRMRKGATVIDNLALMKKAMGLGIRLDGNLILEFPGSTETEVEETLAALDSALPFTPLSAATFFLGAGSPMAISPERYGIRRQIHHRFNRRLFPTRLLEGLHLLVNEYRGTGASEVASQRRLWQPVRKKIRDWQRFHAARPDRVGVPALSWREGGSFLIIRQELPGRATLHHRLKGTSRAIYLACEEVQELDQLLAAFPGIGREKMLAFLNGLVAKRLLFSQGTRFLALAVKKDC